LAEIADEPRMDLDFSMSALFAGMFVSTLGTGIFIYGKKAAKFLPLTAGGAMCIYPLFIYSPLVLWSLTGALCLLLFLTRE
jgi:hypothetical protein